MKGNNLVATGNKLIEILIARGSDKFAAQNKVSSIIKYAPEQLLPMLARFEKGQAA